MNILTEALPTFVEIDNKIYELNTDFRTCLKIIIAFEDPSLVMHEKQILMLSLLYKTIPDNIEKACEMAIKFLDCGEKGLESTPNDNIGRLYSFEKDGRFIYTAIKQSHHVDLEQIEYLHWWKFIYLFLDINESCFFNKLIYLRKQKKLGKLTKEEREMYYSMKEIIDLPDTYNDEEQNLITDFMNKLNIES